MASCKDYGNNLQSVQQHVKKNQVSVSDDVWSWSAEMSPKPAQSGNLPLIGPSDTPEGTDGATGTC